MCPTLTVSVLRHNEQGMNAQKEMCLEMTVKNRQRQCRRNVLWQTIPCARCSD